MRHLLAHGSRLVTMCQRCQQQTEGRSRSDSNQQVSTCSNCQHNAVSETRVGVRCGTISARIPLEPPRNILGHFDCRTSVNQHRL